MSDNNFSEMINGLMPIFILMMVMGMMSGMMGSGSHSSNPGHPTGKEEKRLFNQLKEQIKDEEKAFRTYADMAAEADRLGMFNLASELRNIAKQEYHHKDTLAEFYLQITEAPERKAIGIPHKYVEITNPGNTIFSVGDIISWEAFKKENDRVRLIGGRLAEGKVRE